MKIIPTSKGNMRLKITKEFEAAALKKWPTEIAILHLGKLAVTLTNGDFFMFSATTRNFFKIEAKQ